MEKKQLVTNELKNTGLVVAPASPENYHATELFGIANDGFVGADSPLDGPAVVFPDGIGWKKVALYYGLPEVQFNKKVDSYSCVLYAIAKQLCYYIFKTFGIKYTVSEMYNAFWGKVTPGRGTTIEYGMESFRKHGWVEDKDYPFTAETTAEEFFRKPPETITLMAEGKLKEWTFHWEVLPRNLKAIFEAYKSTPVVLTGFAWTSYYGEGVYYDYNRQANHAFCGLEPLQNGNNLIDDTYPRDRLDNDIEKDELFKELHSSFSYGSAHRCWVTPTSENNKLSIKYIINMFKNIARDIHGGFWFLKDGKKQKIENWISMLGSIVDEIGVKKNNVTDEELAEMEDFKFFGNK